MSGTDRALPGGCPPENELVTLAVSRGWCLATAESLTGGLVARRIAAAPGSGGCFRGGVVAYASEAKARVLGVPPGPVVTGAAARAMAAGARRLFDADLAVATTGVAGPDELEGQPVGTVWIGIAGPGGETALRRRWSGTPDQVAAYATDDAVRALRDATAALDAALVTPCAEEAVPRRRHSPGPPADG